LEERGAGIEGEHEEVGGEEEEEEEFALPAMDGARVVRAEPVGQRWQQVMASVPLLRL
jgi:hypothetical protein